MSRGRAELLWLSFEPFAGYGFGKAHAACYATIAFRTAYLKAHFPVEFMTAVLTAESRGTTGPARNEKISQAIAECRRLGLIILAPSVNDSVFDFSIEDNKIRFGLSAIKNVGAAAISTILEARKEKPFTSLHDFIRRVDLQKVNKKTMESLIKAGAFDKFGNRASILAGLPEIMNTIDRGGKTKDKNQTSLFDGLDEELPEQAIILPDNIEEFSDQEKLSFEKELLGFFLTDHPLTSEIERIKQASTHAIEEIAETPEGTRVKIGGLISNVKKIITKKSNSEMAFIVLEDNAGISVECVIFPKIFEEYKSMLLRDTIVIISGKLDFKDDRPVVIVDDIRRHKV